MVEEAIELATALVDVARDLLTGAETPAGARRRVRDILPEKSESESAEEDIIRAKRLEKIGELDDVGGDEDEQTWPGQR
jgi:hypothetical protein